MAGASALAFGGPRIYAHETVQQAWLNSAGKRDLNASDIDLALGIFMKSAFALWAVCLGLSLLF